MTSGARYHRVTTYPVISLSACRARPKSRIYSQNQKKWGKAVPGEWVGQPWSRRPQGDWAHRGLLPTLWGPRSQPGTPEPPCGFLPTASAPSATDCACPRPLEQAPWGGLLPLDLHSLRIASPSQHFWEGLLSPALARARGAGDTTCPSPQAGMGVCPVPPHPVPPQGPSAHQLLGHCLDGCGLSLGLGLGQSTSRPEGQGAGGQMDRCGGGPEPPTQHTP